MALFGIFKKKSESIKNVTPINEITDEIQLEQIGIDESNPEASIKAIARLKNQTILAKIAMENPHKEVKNKAIKKIKDQMLLADVMASFINYFGGVKVLRRIDNQVALSKIIMHGLNRRIRKSAINLSNDLQLLEKLSKKDRDKVIKKVALERYNKFFPKYNIMEIQINCPSCSQPVFIYGPVLKFKCYFCMSEIKLNLNLWKLIIKYCFGKSLISWSYQYGFKGLDCKYGTSDPICSKCKKKLEVTNVKTGSEQPIKCPACGFENTTFPAPEWLHKIKKSGRRAEQIFCAEREGEEHDIKSKSIKPIVTSCLQCGSNLKITVKSPRNVTCSYCDTTQYLPDPLWFALHPIKTRKGWYIRWTPSVSNKE